MIYTYEGCCGVPGWERVCPLRDYEEDPTFQCPGCGRSLAQTLTIPLILSKSFEPFRSPVDGSIITTARELAAHNSRNHVVNLHDGYDEKAVQSFTQRAWNQTPETERHKDLAKDMEKAVEKLEAGYTPAPKEYTEEIPDA